jgi:hypothetical protein
MTQHYTDIEHTSFKVESVNGDIKVPLCFTTQKRSFLGMSIASVLCACHLDVAGALLMARMSVRASCDKLRASRRLLLATAVHFTARTDLVVAIRQTGDRPGISTRIIFRRG